MSCRSCIQVLLVFVLIASSCSGDSEEDSLQIQYPILEGDLVVKTLVWESNDQYVPNTNIRAALDMSNCICYDTLQFDLTNNTYYHSFYYNFGILPYDTIVEDIDYGRLEFAIPEEPNVFYNDSTGCFFKGEITFHSDLYGAHTSRLVKNCYPGSPALFSMPSKYGEFSYRVSQDE